MRKFRHLGSYSKVNRKISGLFIKLIFILLILTFLFPLYSQPASAQDKFVFVRIEILNEESEQLCEVGLSQSGVVNFSGRVVINRQYYAQQSFEIDLRATAQGWGVSIAPPKVIVLAGPQNKYGYFKLYVTAPPRESSTTLKQVNITGNWMTYPGFNSGPVEPATVLVKVKPFYQFTIVPERDYVKAWPAETVEYRLTIINQGNAPAQFDATVTDLEGLNDAGFAVVLEQTSIEVPPYEAGKDINKGTIKFKVSGPQNFYPWKSQQTPISIHIVERNSQEENANNPEAKVAERDWSVIYYEVGFYVPEQCIIGIVILVALIITLVWAKKKNRLFWKHRQRKGRRRKKEKMMDEEEK